MGILNNFEKYTNKDCNVRGQAGRDGIGFKLTADGNYDIDNKRLTNVAESVDDNDAVNLKVLKEHTQFHQNNYHLQPSFQFFKNFGDGRKIVIGQPGNPNLLPADHFYRSHIVHHDPRLVAKEGFGSGFGGWAWSSIKMTNDKLLPGTYTAIFEIFTVNMLAGDYIKDETLISQVYGDDHYNIITFSHQRIDNSYTKAYIQFSSDGQAGQIVFQIRYYGSQYDKNIRFIFHTRVVSGKQSTSFNHNIFNVSDVDDNHDILYFENLNLNSNKINGLGNPVDNNDATNKTYVDIKNAQQDIAIADKASKSYVDNQIANVQIDTTPLLPRDGSRSMTGDLDIDEHHILSVKNLTDHKVDDAYSDIVKDLKSVVNKEYLNQNFLKIKGNDYDLNQKVIKNSAPHDDGSYDNNTLVSKAFVDAEIAKLPKPDTDVLKLDGSKSMTGNLDMGMKNILNVDTLNDYTNNSEKDRDLKSAVNKQYLNTHFLKIMGKGDYDFNLGGQIIKNCEPYYDGLFDDNSLVSKAFVDAEMAKLSNMNFLKLDGSKAMQGNLYMNNNKIKNLTDPVDNQDAGTKKYIDAEIAKIPVVDTSGLLPLDGSKAMAGDINMANNSIINLKEPGASDSNHAASVKFVNTIVNNSESSMINLINNKIKESEEGSIEVVQQENVFKKVMDDDEFKEDDSDIHKVGVRNKNFHLVNKKTYEFKIDYDSSLGYYSTRLSIDLIYLPVGSYTMVYEMYIDNGITVDEIDSTSGTLVVGKINSKINGTKTRSIINFTKYTISPGFDDLDIDIKLKGKTDPQTTINVVVYGVKGQVNNVSVNLWDRFYYYDNTSIKFELPVDMNQKDITGVNKITTADLDVNSQIDMKGNKIIGVGDGTSNNDAVNKIQLDAKVATVNNKITQMNKSLNDILTQLTYFLFTDQLIHKNHNTVIFPSSLNKPPFRSVRGNYDKLRISLSGKYLVSYTDSYKNAGQFQIYDDTNSVYLFVIYLSNTQKFTEFAISAVINIQTNNGYGHSDIKLRMVKVNSKDPNPLLAGARKSTFYIKYLHA